jgi:RNA polymerase sigma factor (sigma-70 family)
MASSHLHHLIRSLRRVAAPPDAPALSDIQLLERFVATRDEAAFELLAWRHGPMVLGVCRRVLGDVHEVEDAFQATFLVLAQKAASAARHRSAGGWLYTVAYRVALRARARRATRTLRERPLDEPPLADVPDPAGAAAERDARRVIDEEVSRLPEKYRIPFVLFHLEGRSCAEVAQELGCPIGTVESWLTRARQRLQGRLSRRGLVPSAGLFAALGPQEGWLPRPAVLEGGRAAASTEAAALAAEVMRGFGVARARVVTVILLLAAAAGLAAGTLPRAAAPKQPEPARPAERPGAVEPILRGTLSGCNPWGSVTAIALSPDGKTLASAGIRTGLKLWDAQARRELTTLQDPTDGHGLPTAVAFSPDGRTLASGASRVSTKTGKVAKVLLGAVKLWDVKTGAEKTTLRVPSVEVSAVAFSPDGKTLAAGGGVGGVKEHGEVKVWDLATLEERTFFRGDTGRVTSVAFSPDGKTLAAGMHDYSVIRPGPDDASPDGKTLAPGAGDGAIRLWDVDTGRERARLRENVYSARAVAFSPDGKTLAAVHTVGRYNQVTLWDLAFGRVRARLLGSTGTVSAVVFSPDARTLATGSCIHPTTPQGWWDRAGEVRLWDATTGRPVSKPLTMPHYGFSVAFDGRGKVLAAAGAHGNGAVHGGDPDQITLWDLEPRRAP